MKKQKKISLWVDEELANIFQQLNHKINRSLFEHEFRFCFLIYSISYIDSSELLNFRRESFSNLDKMTKKISDIVLRVRYINNQLQGIDDQLNFLDPYI